MLNVKDLENVLELIQEDFEKNKIALEERLLNRQLLPGKLYKKTWERNSFSDINKKTFFSKCKTWSYVKIEIPFIEYEWPSSAFSRINGFSRIIPNVLYIASVEIWTMKEEYFISIDWDTETEEVRRSKFKKTRSVQIINENTSLRNATNIQAWKGILKYLDFPIPPDFNKCLKFFYFKPANIVLLFYANFSSPWSRSKHLHGHLITFRYIVTKVGIFQCGYISDAEIQKIVMGRSTGEIYQILERAGFDISSFNKYPPENFPLVSSFLSKTQKSIAKFFGVYLKQNLQDLARNSEYSATTSNEISSQAVTLCLSGNKKNV